MEKDYIRQYYNRAEGLTAICKSTECWARGEYPELQIGKEYRVSHIGVLRSCTNIMLEEFEGKEYNSTCFEIYEYGELLTHYVYTKDPRFFAPYLRELYRQRNLARNNEQMVNIAIPAHLRHIEKQYDVRILLAVESGSRAWGFESENSDWDVRFVYVHRPEWYFKVEAQRDVIEHMYEDDVDLAGWELRKTLSLLRRSNPSLLEWFNSPMVYYKDEEFEQQIKGVENLCFNPIKSMYHYNRIYNKHNDRYLKQDGFPLKPFLYYLRGILACQWIEERKTIPPVKFAELLEATVSDEHIKQKIYELIDIKKEGKESDVMVVDASLTDFARRRADYYNALAERFRPEINNVPSDLFDAILFDTANRAPSA